MSERLSVAQAKQLAMWYRHLNIAIASQVLVLVLIGVSAALDLPAVSAVLLLAVLGAGVYAAAAAYAVASTLWGTVAAIFTLLATVFVPCWGLILLLILSSKVNAKLRASDYEIGLLGAKSKPAA
jgi:hypothetical protein